MDKHKKIFILINILFFQTLSIFIFFMPNAKSEVPKKINSINYGLTEKGIYFGIDKEINPRIFWSFGLNYLNYRPGYFDAGFSERIPVDIDIKGLSLSISKYFKEKDKSKWNLFLNSEIGLNSIKAFSEVDLSKLYYDWGNIKIKCSSCGQLQMHTNTLSLIPKLSLGIDRFINNRFKIRTIIGIQYINLNDVNSNYESDFPLPNFINEEVNAALKNINKEIDNFSHFQPSISILFNYKF